jgi:hypothetical protein
VHKKTVVACIRRITDAGPLEEQAGPARTYR